MAFNVSGSISVADVRDGAPSTTPGPTGARSIVRRVYLTSPQSTRPADPTATSINFNTGVIANLTNTWQEEPVDVLVSNTAFVYWSSELQFVESTFGGTQTVTSVGDPVSSINFGNTIQSDNFVQGSSGWRLERDTGSGEVSGLLVRGESVVESSTVGGAAVLSFPTGSEGFSFNGDTGTPQSAVQTHSTTPLVVNRDFSIPQGVTEVFFDSPSDSSGNTQITVGFTANSPTVTPATISGAGSFSINVVVLDASDVIVQNTEVVSPTTVDSTNLWAAAGTAVSASLSLRATYNIASLAIPSSGRTLRVSLSVTGGTNFGPTSFAEASVGDITYRVSKPDDTSAYISSNAFDRFAAIVEGGQGLRVPSARIFEGASAAVTVGNQPVDSLLTVEVSYENTATANQDADLAYSNIFIPFNFEARTYWQSVSMVVGTVDGEELVGSNGDVIGRLRINLVASNNTVVISSISIQTFGAASNISNQMIRGVWRKLS